MNPTLSRQFQSEKGPMFIPRMTTDQFQFLLFTTGFLSIAFYHTQHQVPIYHRKFHKNKLYLYIHIITGITEAFRYRMRISSFNFNWNTNTSTIPLVIHTYPQPKAEALDVLLSFIWSWTSLALVKTLRRGHPQTTRPPYQAGACLRPLITFISYLYEIPALYKLSISALDSFIWARLFIFFFSYTPYIRASYGTIYAISIPLSATLSVHESRVPGASVVFVFAVAFVAGLNRWVTGRSRELRQSKGGDGSRYERMLVSGLIWMGFVELEELRVVERLRELERPVYDEYVEEKVD